MYKGSEFYNRSMKLWLQKNDIEMYSKHNEVKSVVTERLIITLKNKIYKYMTSISKSVYINKLDEIVNKYKNTYHNTNRMKPVNIKDNTYIDFGKQNNNKNLKFKIGHHGHHHELQNTKIFLLKDMLQIGLKRFLWLKKLQILYNGIYMSTKLKTDLTLAMILKFNTWTTKLLGSTKKMFN